MTSSLMISPASASKRYRFSYRVRVENIVDVIDSKKKDQTTDDDGGEHSDDAVLVEHEQCNC